MKVTVFGANGKTGDLTWRRARKNGHEVTVFGRSVDTRYSDEVVRKVAGDVLDYSSVSSSLTGQDAALVCLGPVGIKDNKTLSQGAENIRQAMREHQLSRIVFVSAAGVGDSWSRIPWYSKILFSTMLKTILAEHTREEDILGQDDFDWTAVRAAVLKNGPGVGGVVASNDVQTKTIYRADLADFLVDQLTSRVYLKQAICVTSA
ncbi:MAG: NAD(P)H-binding protein [Pseudomonadota bacterium]